MGSLSLIQGIFPTQGSNPSLPYCRILEWVAYPFSSGSSWPSNWTGISCIAGRFFTNWAIREAWHLFLVNVALGPDKQGHAVQPLHVARRHMPGALVIPLPVLLECINLHLPQGVGQSAAWGGGLDKCSTESLERGSREGGSWGRRMPLRGGLPSLTVTYGHPRVILLPAWQAELWPLPFIDKFICVIV